MHSSPGKSTDGKKAEAAAPSSERLRTWPSDHTMARVSRQMLVDHYVNRNIDAVMRRVAPDVTWIGPLACQRAYNAQDMRRMLEPEYGTTAEIFDETWGIRKVGDACMVIGEYRARVPQSNAPQLEFLQVATFVWAMTSSGPKVVYLSVTNAYDVPASLNRPAVPNEDAVEYVLDAVAASSGLYERLAFDVPGGSVRYVTEHHVMCLDAYESGSMVQCEHDRFPVRQRLAALEKGLPASFVRVHRSCIVNATRVKAIRRFEVELEGGHVRPVAERRYLEVAEAVERAAGRALRE